LGKISSVLLIGQFAIAASNSGICLLNSKGVSLNLESGSYYLTSAINRGCELMHEGMALASGCKMGHKWLWMKIRISVSHRCNIGR
jgi:hypothetical protein